MEVKVCIDTNIYAYMCRGNAEIIELLETANEIIMPVVVIGELFAWFYQGRRYKQNIALLNSFLGKTGVTVVSIDKDIAERYGAIVKDLKNNGTPIPTNDIWIAATAMQTGSKLFTKDEHFKLVPGILLV
ncbi:MAG: type II toxin-antitoxin system VapC family toxin [Spirochaetota bacterium]